MSNGYPNFTPSNEVGYAIGSYAEFVPPFLADTVMIRPFGEYGIATYGVNTKDHGGYWVNCQSAQTDPAAPFSSDITYLVNYELAAVPNVKRVIIALHWYTSLDAGNVAYSQIVPAIGTEVQDWNWNNAPPAEYLVYPWTRANAYYLKVTHQLWPTLDDNALINGIRYLQSAGYEVGLCPIATLMSQNYYFAGGGEWEVDRSMLQWTLGNQAAFTKYLAQYDYFYRHYIDLCVKNNLRPWIIYLGYGMRDITGCGVQPFMVQFVNELRALAKYSKQQLPNTLVTYAADLDEYSYSYLVRQNNGHLDPLWTCEYLDYVGINWFAPLTINDTEDNNSLIQGVCQGEANNFYLPNFTWRASTTDRLISTTTRNFKTGLAQVVINPLVSGVKSIADWLAFYHYYPAINGVLAGVSPLANMFPTDSRLCTHIHGTGPVGSIKVLTPAVGGIAPIPEPLQSTWLTIGLHSYAYLNMPPSIPDETVFNFEFNFAISSGIDITGNYRLFSSPNLCIDSINGTITLLFTTLRGSIIEMPLFYDTKGDILLVWTPTAIRILVNGAYDLTAPVPVNDDFRMPQPQDYVWMGNPKAGNIGYPLPKGYGVWQGSIYYLSLVLGATTETLSGGQYFFDDAYCGIRTAWTPNQKSWMATSFGYGSVHGSAVDPQSRAQVILAGGGAVIPNWYEEFVSLTAVTFRNGFVAWNIQGPYGSTFDIDDVYQAIVMNAAAIGLIDAGAIHQVAWYFDTRNNSAYKALLPDNRRQMFNDAYDYEINSSLNGKAGVQYGGTNAIYVPFSTPSEDLGLSIVPGPLPYEKMIPVQTNVPQT